MKRIIGGTLLLSSVLLAGCAGTPAATSEPTTTSASPTPTPIPTRTASIAQYASILTEYEKGWRDYEDNIGECAFASIGKAVTDQMKVMTCRLTAQTVTLTAKNAAKKIRSLPVPSGEIYELYVRTLKALDPLGAIDAVAVCSDYKAQACSDAESLANGAIRPVVSVLDAWRPYF